MKKVLSMLLSVCLVLTMIPAISFAEEGGQTSGDGNVIPPTESQEEITGTETPETPAGVEAPQADAADPAEDNAVLTEEEEVVTEEPAAAPETDGEEGAVELFEAEQSYQNQWVQDEKGWRYYNNDGMYVTSMQPIGGATYLFDSLGYMQTGLKIFDGNKYYFNPKGSAPGVAGSSLGVRMTGWVTVPNVGKCYFYPMMKKGWQTISGKKYYLDPSTGVMKTGWLTIGSSKYYLNASGVMLTGWQTISKKKYYFNPSTGRMQTKWATIGGKKYYFKADGTVTKGWASISGAKYYFSAKTGVMLTGWITLSKKKYYLNKSTGKMVKGWATISKKKYFFNTKTGVMTKGWVKYGKKRYYTNTKTGVMVTGLKKISGTYYFFNKKTGVMKKNAGEKISGKLYYFQNSGKARMAKGWFKGNDGKKRYSLGKGVVATGTKKIGSTWYVFSTTNGAVTKTIGDDIDKKVQSKTSSTSKLVVVYRAKYQVRIYSGSKNKWTKVKKFDCAIGKPATPTPTGTFKITKKGTKNSYTVDGVQTRYWFWCYYNGKQGIHSGLYYDGGPNDGKDYDTRVNVKSTNGGVRVSYGNAQWIYNNVPVDTTVVIY